MFWGGFRSQCQHDSPKTEDEEGEEEVNVWFLMRCREINQKPKSQFRQKWMKNMTCGLRLVRQFILGAGAA
jgi:hypothetical protein